MKPIQFLGDSLDRIRDFPDDARKDMGFQLDRIQRGLKPNDSKPMPAVGRGVHEIRIWEESGTYRVLYTANLPDAVYVLHAFSKKTQATSARDLGLAKSRFMELMRKL